MGTNSNQDRLLPFATSIIRRKAWSLAGRYGFGKSDADDISQSLIYEVLRRAPSFDPSKGNEAQFVSTVVRNAIATLVEGQKVKRRGFGAKFIRLDAELVYENAKVSPTRRNFDKESYLQATSSSNTLKSRQRDLEIDLERAVSALPPDLRQLAQQLFEMTPTEIAKKTGIPRTTINDRIKLLDQHLLELGLHNYLKIIPSDRKRFR